MNKYQVGYYKDGEEWLKTVSATNEEEAIKQVKNEIPDAEIKDVNQIFEMYQFEKPNEDRDRIDLTTDRFEPNASYWDWGEFTEEGKELECALYETLKDKELYPNDITVKEKDGVTKVYINISGDWKHEHLYLNHVMTNELGYMELSQKTIPDDFYDEGGDSYRAMHVYVMFPDLVRFNELNRLYSSKGEMNMNTDKPIKSTFGGNAVFEIMDDKLMDARRNIRSCISINPKKELDNELQHIDELIGDALTHTEMVKNGDYDNYMSPVNNSHKPIKSSLEDRLIPYLEEFEEGYANAITRDSEEASEFEHVYEDTFFEQFKSDYNLTDTDIQKLDRAVREIWDASSTEEGEVRDMGEMYGVPRGATSEEALKHFE